MGTRFDVILHGQSGELAEGVFNSMVSELSRLEGMMNRFDEYSQVSTINHLARDRAVTIEKELFGILLMCREYYEKTGGLFDVSLGKLADLVRSGHSDPDEMNGLIIKTGMSNVILDEVNLSVRFSEPDVKIDLGGFGKGYAMNCIKSLILSSEISNAFISFGDSSVMALGNHPSGLGWKAGIQHLFYPGDSIYTFELHDESVSTSGLNPKAREVSSPAHIIHPGRGFVNGDRKHISVKSTSALDAEVLSTTLLLAEVSEMGCIMTNFKECHAIQVDYNEAGSASVKELGN